MKTFRYAILMSAFLLSVVIFYSSCVDDPDGHNEQELITTLVYTLSPVGGGEVVEFAFLDTDGDGGNPPIIITTGNLISDKTYIGSIIVRNDASMPPKDITTEIKEESESHQFFFRLSSNLSDRLKISYADIDSKGKPVGLLTDVAVFGPAQNGKLTLILRHRLNKNGTGVSDGNIAKAGGETDIEIEFDVTIQ